MADIDSSIDDVQSSEVVAVESPPAAAAESGDNSTQFSIDDDDEENDSLVNEPLDNVNDKEEEVITDNVHSDVSNYGGDNAAPEEDDKEVTVDAPTPQSPTQDKDEVVDSIKIATDKSSGIDDANNEEENHPKSPPRISSPTASSSHSNKKIISPVISPKKKTIPQSQKSPSPSETTAEGNNNDQSPSLFGPFIDTVINSDDWNPFGENDNNNAAMFDVDEDIHDDKNTATTSNINGERPTSPTQQSSEAELDSLRRVFDSEYERALEDQEISWRARYGATRLSFVMSALLMVVYLWLGCMFYRSEAGWSIPDALLFTVYTVTTVGYGGPMPLPNTAAFHAFTSIYILVGISLVTVLGAHTYQLVTLETTKLQTRRLNQTGQGRQEESTNQEALAREIDKYREQFMTELEDLVRERPLLDATIVKIKEFQIYLRTTKTGQFLAVVLPFLGMIFLGAIVVGTIEKWSPLESIYWSIVTLTTVGYGDYVPTKNSSVWFCTLFFIPSALFFLSFFLAHVAKAYIRLHAIHVTRLERKMRRECDRRRREEKTKRIAEAAAAIENVNPALEGQKITVPEKPPDSPGGGGGPEEDMENGFTTIISYAEDQNDDSPTKSSALFGEEAGNIDDHNNDDPDSSPSQRYRENVIRNKEAAPDPHSNRPVTFAEAHRSLNRHSSKTRLDEFANESQQGNTTKPSLDVRLRVQARLARIIAEEVAGYQTGVIIKGSTVSLTVGSLRDTSEKWKIPAHAWKAFRAVAFRSILFVGERELISNGGDALLELNVVEFHQIFSPMLAAMGDGSSMETWLAQTDILADVELRGGSRYGKKPIFKGTFT